ncbi:MAG TPA: hypothetical protein VNZ50_16445 [Hyphomicrobiaceae bacterium]|nr:hypothetical protein [Hyphomicrobiaceae bacterium]
MATILDFPEMQVPARRRPSRRVQSSAEVILFPGVRYERREDAPADRQPARGMVVRDRLQLIE